MDFDMTQAILITECLQNDFVQLLDIYDPLPNALHVGYKEAERLLGEKVEEGPVTTIMKWAYSVPDEDLVIIHIRDWHDEKDPLQKDHLNQFGNHCIKNSKGAEFVFQSFIRTEKKHHIINASGLNDFYDTDLENILQMHKGKKIRIGLIGVWTEAKITFLAYELKTRYQEFDIAVCSALTASSSRSMHFTALDQLKNILGINIFSSIGSFTNFLTGKMPSVIHGVHPLHDFSRLHIENNYSLRDIDKKLLLYLHRDCKDIYVKCLDGGFSGNVVLKSKSKNLLGHEQVPTVIKIGDRDLIASERISFERIQEVLGNNAPAIVDFVELEERGAIKYRYAAMLEGNVRTFQDVYNNSNIDIICQILDTVFIKQLGRLYSAAVSEKINLLDYYDFSAKYASHVKKNIEALLKEDISGKENLLIEGIKIANIYNFYETDLKILKEYGSVSHYMSYIHGDLNGRNIIIDDQDNIWLIDFFHTHKGHILRDLIKLENDILYIMTPVNSADGFKEAVQLSTILININDLGVPLDNNIEFQFPQFNKAFSAVKLLRSYYSQLIQSDRDPYQMHVGLLRYAVHTISFDESTDLQKKWALYSASLCSEKIKQYLLKSNELRIDYIRIPQNSADLRIGITILPGRKDRERNLQEDILTIKNNGIDTIVCLITYDEFIKYGVANLKESYKNTEFDVYYFPIIDQGVPTKQAMLEALEWIHNRILHNKKILIHCIGGLGRSGTVAACYIIKYCNISSAEAVQIVRQNRSERAIESLEQINFINNF